MSRTYFIIILIQDVRTYIVILSVEVARSFIGDAVRLEVANRSFYCKGAIIFALKVLVFDTFLNVSF